MTGQNRNLDVIPIGRAGGDLYGAQICGRLEDATWGRALDDPLAQA